MADDTPGKWRLPQEINDRCTSFSDVGETIRFQERAVARLRERLGAAEQANEDLIAFARGHSGAAASIHAATLAAIEADSIESFLDVLTRDWPPILGIDAVAIALIVGKQGFRADLDGIERVEAQFVERMVAGLPAVRVHNAAIGHPLFGASRRDRIGAEALIRIDSAEPFPRGLIALGQRAEIAVESSHGSGLLLFLGQIAGATLRRLVATS